MGARRDGKTASVLRCVLAVLLLLAFPAFAAAGTLTLPAALRAIDDYAFYGDESLERVVLPEGIETLGEYAFADSSLREIVLPASLTGIADTAFDGCAELRARVQPDSYALEWCRARQIACETTPTAIGLIPSSLSLTAGEQLRVEACIAPEEAANAALVWTSDAESVASVAEDGTITAHQPGTAVIRAASAENSAVYAACEVTVLPVSVALIELADAELTVGQVFVAQLKVLPTNATNQAVLLSSNNNAVCMVSPSTGNGSFVLAAMGAGDCTITATAADGSGAIATCTVTVAQPVKVTGISFEQPLYSGLACGDALRLTPSVTPGNATNQNLVWSSSAPDVAVVSEDGVVTGVAGGACTITAAAADGSGVFMSCTVLVNPNAALEFADHTTVPAAGDAACGVTVRCEGLMLFYGAGVHVYAEDGTLVRTLAAQDAARLDSELRVAFASLVSAENGLLDYDTPYRWVAWVIAGGRTYYSAPTRFVTLPRPAGEMPSSAAAMVARLAAHYTGDMKTAAVEIATIMLDAGFEPAFIAGIVGNVKYEGAFGQMENLNYSSARLAQMSANDYRRHMNGLATASYALHSDAAHGDYLARYSGRCIYSTDRNGAPILVGDIIAISDYMLNTASCNGNFAVGCIQWSGSRRAALLAMYRAEAGDGVITRAQAINAEMKMMVAELQGSHRNVYTAWKSANSTQLDTDEAAYQAGVILCQRYEVCYNNSLYSVYDPRASEARTAYNVMMGH